MELSEVVNPHFAFPVVGVVLCAVLVFAFGFKSPVQPPSFDDEPKKPTKKSKPKKKTPSNGHIVNVESTVSETRQSTNRSPASGKQTSAAKDAVVTEKSPKAQKDTVKPKMKKSSTKTNVEPKNTFIIDQQDSDVGWETVRDTKKKKKGKKEPEETGQESIKESGQDSMKESGRDPMKESEEVKEAEEVLKVTVSQQNETPSKELLENTKEAAQPQRNKRDKSKTKSKEPEKPAPSDLSDKENTPEPVKEAKSENLPVKKDAKKKKATKSSPDTEVTQLEEKEKDHPRASSIVASNTLAADSTAVKPQSATKSSGDKKSDDTSSASQNTAQSNISSVDSKSSKSPKKKKEKQKKVPEAVAVSPSPVSSKAPSETSLPSAAAVSQSITKSSVTHAQDAAAVTSTLTEVAPSLPVAEKGEVEPQATPNITFDEMGDMWQEAKPTKKKKAKARRDN